MSVLEARPHARFPATRCPKCGKGFCCLAVNVPRHGVVIRGRTLERYETCQGAGVRAVQLRGVPSRSLVTSWAARMTNGGVTSTRFLAGGLREAHSAACEIMTREGTDTAFGLGWSS